MQTTQLPAIEGLTPSVLWYTMFGLVCLGSLIVLGDKVLDVFRKKHERDRLKKEPEDKLAETISSKVLQNLEPRFSEIDRKLATDKSRLDEHTRLLGAHEDKMEDIARGNKVLCRGLLAMLSHEINGNSNDKLKASQQEITDYLIDK